MKMRQLTLGDLGTNCYILWDESGEGAVIDPADDAARILQVLAQEQISLRWVLLTHAHFDHMLAAGEILRATSAELMLHEADAPALSDPIRNLTGLFGYSRLTVLEAARLLRENDAIHVGTTAITVLHTPGHTPGSCCYYDEAGGRLFAGDTLFAGSVGRTDFPGGSAATLHASLMRLMELPDDVTVYPGHDEMTTIGDEGLYNPYIG